MHILNHRGIDMDDGEMVEGHLSSYRKALGLGLGIEFDLNASADGVLIVHHDKTLKRHSQGRDSRPLAELSFADIRRILGEELSPRLSDVIDLINTSHAVSALHLKGYIQTEKNLRLLVEFLRSHQVDFSMFIVFDLTIEAARYLRKAIPELALAPSVAHADDKRRFNDAVGGTLYTVEEVLGHRDLFDWVWLDEWDRKEKKDSDGKFYTFETFRRLRAAGFQIGLVTPELHYSSTALLGGEAHEDGAGQILVNRIEEICELKPDLICTDKSIWLKQKTFHSRGLA